MKIIFQISLAFCLAWLFVSQEDKAARALRIYNQKASIPYKKKILFAFSSDEDIQVQATTLLRELKCSRHDLHTNTICGNILFHFKNGLGSELHITKDFQNLVQIAKEFSTQQDLGGNAAQMALRAFKDGGDVYLSAVMSEKYYSKLYNSSITIVPQELLKPQINDVHIVVNYDQGDVFDSIKCEYTNRLYLQNDQDNVKFPGLDKLEKEIQYINPDLFVVGGFQLMNQKSRSEYQEIILKLEQLVFKIKNSVKIHFEMGAFNDEQLLLFLVEHVFPHIHSTGLNEQELSLLYNFITQGEIKEEEAQLTTNQQIKMTIDLIKLLKLERVHFHSQTIQMICSNQEWKNIQQALYRSILVGLIQAMKIQNDNQVDDVYFDSSELELQIEEEDIILYPTDQNVSSTEISKDLIRCWSIDNRQCCIAPVLINPHPMRTCGLGDNIGASSLLLQLI